MDETSKIKPGETDPPTAAERAEWARLCEAATPGPWEAGRCWVNAPRELWITLDDGSVSDTLAWLGTLNDKNREADTARLIAAARNALPRLLTALDAAEQRAERAETRATGLEVAWRNAGAAAESERVRANKLETERDALKAHEEWAALPSEDREWVALELISVGAESSPTGANRRATDLARRVLAEAPALLARLEEAERLLREAREELYSLGMSAGHPLGSRSARKAAEEIHAKIDAFLAPSTPRAEGPSRG